MHVNEIKESILKTIEDLQGLIHDIEYEIITGDISRPQIKKVRKARKPRAHHVNPTESIGTMDPGGPEQLPMEPLEPPKLKRGRKKAFYGDKQ